MRLSKAEREAGYKTIPQPSEHDTAILRRVSADHLLVTLRGEGKEPEYTYGDGTPIRDARNRPMLAAQFRRMVERQWLVPIKGEALFPGGPAQRYRARGAADSPLPKVIQPRH